MINLLLHFNIGVIYNQYKDNETGVNYDIKDFINTDMTLKESIDYIFNLYNIKLSKEQKKHKYSNLTEYIFGCFKSILFDYNEDDVMNTKIGALEEYFKISERILSLHYVDGIGGTLGESEGIRYFFHTREKDLHNIPHIHCEYSGEEFRVNLYTLEIMDNSFKSKKKTKLAIDVVSKNKDEFIRIWDLAVVKGLPFKFKGEI